MARIPLVTVGLHQQSVSGQVAVVVEHEHTYELTATTSATVTLDGVPGAQVAIVWTGADGTVEGQPVSDGQVWVAVQLTAGWRLFAVGGDAPAPGTVGNPNPTVGAVTADSVTVTWPAVSGATGYRVRVNGGASTDVGNVLTYTASGLPAATAGTIEVQAYGPEGSSSWVSRPFTTTAAAAVFLRMTPNDASITESGDAGTGWSYAFAATPYQKGLLAAAAMKLPASSDGEIRCTVTASTAGGATVRLKEANDTSFGVGTSGGSLGIIIPVVNGTNVYNVNASPAANATTNVVAANGDLVRVRRAGTTLYAEVSKDAGTTWTAIYSKPSVNGTTPAAPLLYASVMGNAYTVTLSKFQGVGFA